LSEHGEGDPAGPGGGRTWCPSIPASPFSVWS
jgi:hypothetical protein